MHGIFKIEAPLIRGEIVTKNGMINLEEIEVDIIVAVYEACNYNKTKAAAMLGISLRKAGRKIKSYYEDIGADDPGAATGARWRP